MYKELKEKLTGDDAKAVLRDANKMMAFRIFNFAFESRGGKRYYKKAGKRVGLELYDVVKVDEYESILCYRKAGKRRETK